MSEVITTYLLTDLDQPLPMDRKEFYDSEAEAFKTTGKPTRSAAISDVLIFTPDKDIIIQKRSPNKMHNPGLIDKTIGGHVSFGNSYTYTVITETIQELHVPSIVLESAEEFIKTYRLMGDYLQTSALIQFIDKRTVNLEKIYNGDTVQIANSYHFYLGVYDGPVKPADKEATGIMFYSFDQLHKEIAAAPSMFAYDLKFFLREYEEEIDQFLSKL